MKCDKCNGVGTIPNPHMISETEDYYCTRDSTVCKVCNTEFFDDGYKDHKCIEPKPSKQEDMLIKAIAKEYVAMLREEYFSKKDNKDEAQ